MTSLKKHQDRSAFLWKALLYLNRHQTEEWKGWMQVLFLLYHYFAATEIYNAIRTFIAAYVWMSRPIGQSKFGNHIVSMLSLRRPPIRIFPMSTPRLIFMPEKR